MLVLSAKATSFSGKLAKVLSPRGIEVDAWDEERLLPDRTARKQLDEALGAAAVVVLFCGRELAVSGALKRMRLGRQVDERGSYVIVAPVDDSAAHELPLSGAGVFAPRGPLGKLAPADLQEALELLAQEIILELDPSYAPQPVSHFEEYQLLFENAERLFDRRQNAAQIFLGINAAVCTAFAFAAKDLGLPASRLMLVTVPLVLAGVLACNVWLRAIRQYETMLEWRFRQLRRMERRGFSESYRIFTKEWDAIYRPRRKGPFGFTRLENFAPRAFLAIYLVGLVLVLIQWWVGSGASLGAP